MKNNIFSPAWVHKKYYLGSMDRIDMNFNTERTDMFFYSHEDRYVVKVRREGNAVRTSIEKVIQFDYDIYELDFNLGYKTPSEMKEMYLCELPKEYLDKAIEEDFIPDPKTSSHCEDKVLYDDKTKMAVCIDAEEWFEYSLFPLWHIVSNLKIDIEEDEELDEMDIYDNDIDILEVMISRINGTQPE